MTFFANSSVVDQGYAKGMPFELVKKKKIVEFREPRIVLAKRALRSIPHPMLLRQYDARVIPSVQPPSKTPLLRGGFRNANFSWVCGR